VTDTDSSRFSLVAFAVALVTVSLSTAAGLAFVPVVGAYLGTLLGGFVAGLALEGRPTLEGGVAAVLAGLGVLTAGPFVGTGVVAAITALGAISPLTLLVSVVLSFAVGAFGAHFGDDLRDGLTEPLEEPAPAPGPITGSPRVPPTRVESAEVEAADVERADAEQAADEPGGRPSEEPESADLELERND
jgi:hypothetical protein